VGFHTDPSDIKIAFELIDLPHDIELLTAGLFEKDAFAEHEHADLISFFTPTFASRMALKMVSSSSVEMINRTFIFLSDSRC
jgi:hypothetical protein